MRCIRGPNTTTRLCCATEHRSEALASRHITKQNREPTIRERRGPPRLGNPHLEATNPSLRYRLPRRSVLPRAKPINDRPGLSA